MKNKILNSMIGLLLLSAGVAQEKAPKTEPKPEKKATEEAKSAPSVDEILSSEKQRTDRRCEIRSALRIEANGK